MNYPPWWGSPMYPPPPQQPHVVYVPMQPSYQNPPQTPVKIKGYKRGFGVRKGPTLTDVVMTLRETEEFKKFLKEQEPKKEDKKSSSLTDKFLALVLLVLLGPAIGVGYYKLLKFLMTF